ncbi:MAG: MFS transporter [Ignavibacteriales bacterium]|nr:MFS transporter [Ignavibacteriales bacterium]
MKVLSKKLLREITQPFKDLFKASRALWGINLSYLLEGITYFGIVGYLVIYFNNYIKLDDISAGQMVGIQTAGITLAMLFLGATVDWIGVRRSLLYALGFMLIGRLFLTIAPNITSNVGLWSSAHLVAMLGIFGIVLGYGIYQPACYAAVKQFTTEKTSAMGYAMLYALMNLGGFLRA